MSDTPRTDAVAKWEHHNGLYRVITTGTIDVDFVRTLEREGNLLRAEVEELKKEVLANNQTALIFDRLDAEQDRDRWREDAERLAGFIDSILPAPPFDCRTEAEWLTAVNLITGHEKLKAELK